MKVANLEARRRIYNILHDDYFSWTPDSVEALQMAMDALKDFPTQMSGTSEEPKQPDSGFTSCKKPENMHVGTTDDRKLAKVLADTLDGTPLLYACDKLWSEHGWCEEHCGQHQQEPDAECWMRYAEVMAE